MICQQTYRQAAPHSAEAEPGNVCIQKPETKALFPGMLSRRRAGAVTLPRGGWPGRAGVPCSTARPRGGCPKVRSLQL